MAPAMGRQPFQGQRALTVYQPYGFSIDPAVATAAIQGATTIATASIAAAKSEGSSSGKSKAKRKAKHKAKAVFQPAVAPPPATDNTALYIGGGIALLALLAGGSYLLTRKGKP